MTFVFSLYCDKVRMTRVPSWLVMGGGAASPPFVICLPGSPPFCAHRIDHRHIPPHAIITEKIIQEDNQFMNPEEGLS